MFTLRRTLLTLCCCATFVTPVYAQQYTVVDLGTLGGSYSYGNAVNNVGDVTGSSYVAGDTAQHAFLWQSAGMVDLGTLGGVSSTGKSINNSGQVVGNITFDNNGSHITHAFSYTKAGLVDLGFLNSDDLYSQVYGVDDAGQVVGSSGGTAFTYTANAGMLPLFPQTDATLAVNGISQNGQITGLYYNPYTTGTHDALLYANGQTTDLGQLGGGSTTGRAVNNSGQVVGVSIEPDNNPHGFLSQSGVMTDLGNLGAVFTYANAINNYGQTVGFSEITGGQMWHAFLYQNGTMTDLNTLISANSGWELLQANGISDTGFIAGSGVHNGQTHAFLLKPLPPVALQSFSITPSTITNGQNATATVSLSGNAPSMGITVNLTSNNSTIASVPANVVISAGNSYTTFPVTSYSVTDASSVTITATYNGISQTSTLTVKPTAPAHTFTAAHVAAGNNSSVLLWNSNTGAAFVQTVQANGATTRSATFGPYTGASAKAVAVAPDGTIRLLWTNTNGTASVWSLTAAGAVTSYGTSFGPYTGSTATGI